MYVKSLTWLVSKSPAMMMITPDTFELTNGGRNNPEIISKTDPIQV